jgi:hypothetical protein
MQITYNNALFSYSLHKKGTLHISHHSSPQLNNFRAEYEVALLSAPRTTFVTLYRVSQEERSVFWEVSCTIDH